MKSMVVGAVNCICFIVIFLFVAAAFLCAFWGLVWLFTHHIILAWCVLALTLILACIGFAITSKWMDEE